MKILFCNDIYPGIFGKMPARLASDSANEVMFLSSAAEQGYLCCRMGEDVQPR